MPKKKWLGTPPCKCDICGGAIKKVFVDGKTAFGPWGMMCPMYTLTGKDWVKTGG
jgi:hypothetical protein